eukprot:8494-Heterococcus_DN1.PRE.8
MVVDGVGVFVIVLYFLDAYCNPLSLELTKSEYSLLGAVTCTTLLWAPVHPKPNACSSNNMN